MLLFAALLCLCVWLLVALAFPARPGDIDEVVWRVYVRLQARWERLLIAAIVITGISCFVLIGALMDAAPQPDPCANIRNFPEHC